jgi:putative ABC transport system permease protein
MKFAWRSIRKNPGFSALAIVVMALGIGANTAVFTVVNAVLLRPLAYDNPERIVSISNYWKKTGLHGQASAPDFHDWHDQTTAFTAMAYYGFAETAIAAGNDAEYTHVSNTTAEFFRVLSVEPVIGRTYTEAETRPGGGEVAVISYAYWQSHFGGQRDVLGQTLRGFNKVLNVIGVMPPGFHFPDQTDIWFPANAIFPETTSRSAHNYIVIGRLKPEATLEQAQTQLSALGDRLEERYPQSNSGKNVAVLRMRDEMVKAVRLTLYLLLGAVGLVLLMACTNVANLLLAKATTRTREIAIRTAIGASRRIIVRQLISESLLLGLLAGAGGLLLAVWGAGALVALAPSDVPRLAESGIDMPVLLFTFAISIAASLLFGIAPAIQASRLDVNDALKQGSNRTGSGLRTRRMRAALVVVEIAVSVVLLVGASLLLKSLYALQRVELGFRPEQLLVMQTAVPSSDLEAAQRAGRFYQDLLGELAALPGVQTAAGARSLPGRVFSNGGYWIDRLPGPEGLNVNSAQAVFSVITPDMFRTFSIPIKAGRDFNATDTFDAPFTAVINDALAKKSFPNEDPIGRTIFCGFDGLAPMKIVGVVGDIRQSGPGREPRPEIFMPYLQHPRASAALSIVVRSADSNRLPELMRSMARERRPDVPVRFTTMEALLAESMAAARFRTLLLTVFAALAVSLAVAGVFGLMATVVSERAGEIGIRMAVGAGSQQVAWLVLQQTLLLSSVGLAIGMACAYGASRVLTNVLFEVKPGDPATYITVALLLTAVAFAASYLPVRRAMRIDPMIALRQE